MPEIGASLNEARLRRKLDLVQVEADTKIRARYLRALEEEEWDVLPGPTYVKTFLRTYGEYLGLDAKVLVEEYKQRYERPTPQELTPFSTNLGSRRERRRARGPVISPGVIVVVLVVALIGALAAIGIFWGDPAGDETAPSRSTRAGATPTPAATGRRRTARTVRLQLVAEAPVYVCLVSRSGRRLLDGVTLTAGQRTRRFSGRRFRATFGNGFVRMRVNRRSYPAPDTNVPLGYEIRPHGAPRRLSDAARPDCS